MSMRFSILASVCSCNAFYIATYSSYLIDDAAPKSYTLSLHDALPIYFGDCLTYGAAIASSRPLLFKGEGFTHTDVRDRKSTRLNSSHVAISYAVFCLKKKIAENR